MTVDEVASVDARVERLERLTEDVRNALIELRAGDVLNLIIEQCECMRTLSEDVLEGDQVLRMQRIAKMVCDQQELIGQTLRTTEHFMRQVQQSNPFSETC